MMKIKNLITLSASVFILVGCGSGSDQSSNELQSAERVSSTFIVEEKPSNWYIRLVAEDPNRALESVSTQLGQLDESDTVENHTLKALTPFESTYLDVVFKNPAGVSPGDYKVSFHTYEEGSEDRWRFTVRTDDINADILLSWRGLYILTPFVDDQDRLRYKENRSMTNPLIKCMKLVDSISGTEMAAMVDGEVQMYSFNMKGQKERTFEWVIETDQVSIPVQTSKLLSLTAKAVQKDASIDKAGVMSKKIEKFDLNRPPRVKEENFGK